MDVKCRKCGKINHMVFGRNENTPEFKKLFNAFIDEHCAFPIKRQCSCDNSMMMLQDIVSFGNVLDI